MKFILCLFLIFGFSISSAQSTSTDPWGDLLIKIVETGTVTNTGFAQIRSLSRVTPNDETQPRTAEYMSMAGVVDDKGVYSIIEVAGTSENWTVDKDGNWVIDQWFYYAKPDGSLNRAEHNSIVKKPDTSVVVTKVVIMDTQDQLNARWETFLKSWY